MRAMLQQLTVSAKACRVLLQVKVTNGDQLMVQPFDVLQPKLYTAPGGFLIKTIRIVDLRVSCGAATEIAHKKNIFIDSS